MARIVHLASGINLFTTTENQENIGNTVPSSSTSQGFAKGVKGTNTDLDSETGFFINTDKNFELWIFYSNTGWQMFADVDLSTNQGNFATGISVAWLNSTTHGEALGAYFRTDETDHEIRVIRRTKRIQMDLLPGDNEVEKDVLVHSLAAANLDYDGEVTGAGTIAHIEIDTTGLTSGQTVTFQREGDFYYGLVTMNDGKEIESTLTHDQLTNQLTCSFQLPDGHTDRDSYTLHISLKESSAPVPTYQLTADNYSVTEGQTVTVTLNTVNVADGTVLPYTITGTNIDLDDFNGLGSLTGTFIVNGGTATTSFVTAADGTTEGVEVFTLTLDNAEAAVSVTIEDTSKGIVLQGLKMVVTVGNDNYGNGSLEYRIGGRGDFTEINWGDGNTTAYNNTTEQSYDSASHVYSSPGTYLIEVKGSGTISPSNTKRSATKWIREGFPLYDALTDTSNVGPMGMNRPGIALDFSTVTDISASGQTMVITDSANTDWASIVTGASYGDVIGGVMQMIINGEVHFSEITNAVTNGNTTTITIAKGQFYIDTYGTLETKLVNETLSDVLASLLTYPPLVVLRPDLSQHPNFEVYNFNYGVHSGMWSIGLNMPVTDSMSKLMQISHWGTDFTHNMLNGSTNFADCVNMDITASDSPDFSNLTYINFRGCSSLVDANNTLNSSTVFGAEKISLHKTFENCTSYNNDLTNWNTENVTDMLGTFNGCTVFNGDLSSWNTENVITFRDTFRNTAFNNDSLANWNTENVTSFLSTFYGCSNFNGDITNWRTDSADTLQNMFYSCSAFNRDINTKVRADGNLAWDVKAVTDFSAMMCNCSSFNLPISYWNLNESVGVNFYATFKGCTLFNQDLITQQVTVGSETYVAWNTINVISFYSTFQDCTNFNGDITNWDTSYVSIFYDMFHSAINFNQPIDTHSVTVTGVGTYDAWDTKRRSGASNYRKFYKMFWGAYRFNQDLNNWNVTDGTDMGYMFYKTYVFNGNITSWDISGKTSLEAMFYYAYSFNQDISNWDTSSVGSMSYMFTFAYSFNQDLPNWDVSSVYTFHKMFMRAGTRSGYTGTLDLSNWSLKTTGTINMSYMFYMWSPVVTLTLSPYGGSDFSTAAPQWHPVVTNWNVERVNNMSYMFHSFGTLGGIDMSNWNCTTLTSLASTFHSCTTFDGGGLHNSSFPVLSNMSSTFWGTGLADVDMSNYGSSGNLTNITNCFRGVGTAANPSQWTGLGLENWDVSACASLSHTFIGGNDQFNGNIENWDISNVTSLHKVLQTKPYFNRDLSNWNTGNVTDFTAALDDTAANFDPSNWDVSSATVMSMLFAAGSAASWDQARVDSVMASWGSQTVQNDVTLTIDVPVGVGVPTSGAGLTGYNNLVNNYNWTISIY